MNVGKVDCTEEDNQELCVQFNIKGYPTVVLLKDDTFYKFGGRRDYGKLVEFALAPSTFKETSFKGPIPKR